MKRIIALMLVLLLTLTACVRQERPSAETRPAETTENPVPEAEEPAPEAEEPTAGTEEPVAGTEEPTAAAEAPDLSAGCLELTGQLPFSLDWDGDGREETIDIQPLKTNAEADGVAFPLQLENDGTVWRSMDPGIWNVALYLTDLGGDGSYELFLTGDAASDDYVTYGWRLTDGDPEPIKFTGEVRYDNVTWVDYVEGCFVDVTGNGQIRIDSFLYMLGTYGGVRPYAFNDKGEIAPVEGTIWDYPENSYALTLRTALTAEAVAERNGNPTGETLTLEAGDKLTLTGSDGVSHAWFETADGRFGVLEVEKQDWQWFIGGMEENEVFSDLPYAG